MLWTVNKPCYNDSLCLHEYAKMIGLKTFTHVQEQKKAMSRRHAAYIPSSVKSPL